MVTHSLACSYLEDYRTQLLDKLFVVFKQISVGKVQDFDFRGSSPQLHIYVACFADKERVGRIPMYHVKLVSSNEFKPYAFTTFSSSGASFSQFGRE